jgi:hypothetical protein
MDIEKRFLVDLILILSWLEHEPQALEEVHLIYLILDRLEEGLYQRNGIPRPVSPEQDEINRRTVELCGRLIQRQQCDE